MSSTFRCEVKGAAALDAFKSKITMLTCFCPKKKCKNRLVVSGRPRVIISKVFIRVFISYISQSISYSVLRFYFTSHFSSHRISGEFTVLRQAEFLFGSCSDLQPHIWTWLKKIPIKSEFAFSIWYILHNENQFISSRLEKSFTNHFVRYLNSYSKFKSAHTQKKRVKFGNFGNG